MSYDTVRRMAIDLYDTEEKDLEFWQKRELKKQEVESKTKKEELAKKVNRLALLRQHETSLKEASSDEVIIRKVFSTLANGLSKEELELFESGIRDFFATRQFVSANLKELVEEIKQLEKEIMQGSVGIYEADTNKSKEILPGIGISISSDVTIDLEKVVQWAIKNGKTSLLRVDGASIKAIAKSRKKAGMSLPDGCILIERTSATISESLIEIRGPEEETSDMGIEQLQGAS